MLVSVRWRGQSTFGKANGGYEVFTAIEIIPKQPFELNAVLQCIGSYESCPIHASIEDLRYMMRMLYIYIPGMQYAAYYSSDSTN